MSKEFVRKWYNGIPPVERNLPILLHNGKVYTPNEIYNEVMKGTKLGEELQMKLERLSASHSFTIDDLKEVNYLAELRVEEVLKNLPNDIILTAIGGGESRFYRPSDIKNTDLYKKALEEEKKKVIKLLRG